MNRTIASLTIGTALTLALASAYFFITSSPSTGQSNTGAVAPVASEQLDTLEQGGKSATTPDDPIIDFLAAENWITIPAGNYEIGCEISHANCKKYTQGFRVSKNPASLALWERCVNEGACASEPSAQSHTSYSVVNISKSDVDNYIEWLDSRFPSITFRLPSSDELLIASKYISTGAPVEWSDTCRKVSDLDQHWGLVCQEFSCRACALIKVADHNISSFSETFKQDIARDHNTTFRLIIEG